MTDQPRTPGLEHVAALIADTALASARTFLPGRVSSYDPNKQSVAVQIMIKEPHVAEDDEDVVEIVAELHDVPVVFYGGPSGRITVPILKGDVGRIVWSMRSIAKWKNVGGIVDPDDPRVHDINDCVFEPGLHDFKHVPTSAPTDAIVMHGATKVGGPTGTQKTYMAETHITAMDTMLDAMTAFVAAFNVFFTAMSTDVGLLAVAPVSYAAAGVLQPLILQMNTAIAAFKAGDSTYKTQLAEVK